MLIDLIAFSIFGALVTELVSTDKEFTFELVGASFGLLAIIGIFIGLTWVCGYSLKRCFE
ncbi:hypothetical protein [Microbulbifer sp. ANSA005]|uniref:hypothetical protein n=1 Tax=Microbulbifer sp. ANSA005 TaxID=3243362 RepID=UPI00404155AE